MSIGIFDSGLGGLTIVRALREKYPKEKMIYYGDTLRVPYGEKKPEELIHLAERITVFLMEQGAQLIVDACNTTSALALDLLREKYGHEVEIIGVVEPGAARAAALAKAQVGLMATQATVNSGAYQRKIFSRRSDLDVHSMACPQLVPFIESGDLSSYPLQEALEAYLEPLLKEQMDVLIMGCTHYPLLRPMIERIVGEGVLLVDPGKEVVNSIVRYPGGDHGASICYTSSDAQDFAKKADLLVPDHGFGTFVTYDLLEER